MADPRNDVRFDEIGYRAETFIIDGTSITYSATEANGSAGVGLAVTLSADKTISLTGDAEQVLGKLISVQSDGKATVQTCGYMTLPGGASATLTVGTHVVGDLGAASAEGYIRTVNTAVAAELGVMNGSIVDASTTTAVVVKF